MILGNPHQSSKYGVCTSDVPHRAMHKARQIQLIKTLKCYYVTFYKYAVDYLKGLFVMSSLPPNGVNTNISVILDLFPVTS